MDDDNTQNDPTQDNRDPDMEQDKRMFHPDQVERLAEDGARPAEPAHDVPGAALQADYPQTDSNVDPTEVYNEGLGNASGVNINHEDSDTVEKAIDENQDTTGRIR